MLAYFLQGLLLGATASAQPGPMQAFLLSLTTQYGWRRATPAAFAPLISDGPILLLVLFILSSAPQLLLNGLQIAGGVFLLYLAFGSFLSFKNVASVEASTDVQPGSNLLKGALINLLSPNPYIFWITIAGPILIAGWREAPRFGLSFIAGFYLTLIGGFLAFVAIFALTGKLDARLNRALSGLAALALFLFGLFQVGKGILQIVQA